MKLKHGTAIFSRTFTLTTFAALTILMPEDMAHLLAVAAHIIYESVAFAIESLLIHSLGLSKFQAQMAVFYGSCGIGAALAYILIRRMPTMLSAAKTNIEAQWQQFQIDLLLTWESLPWRRKAQFLLIQFAGISGGLIYMLA